MSEQEVKFTEEGLKESIKNGDIETIEKFVSLSGEDILSQLGVDGQYDDLLDAAVDTGNLKMVKTLLKRSNLIQASMDNFIDGLDENDSDEIKDELRKFAGLERRSNLQTYKGKWNEWQAGLKKAKENSYDDLVEKLENRMQFENDRRLEMEGKRPEGTSENRWFLNENSWTLNGKGGLEYPMYGQNNAETIREELEQAGIEVEETHYNDKKTNSSTDYRIRVDKKDKEKLKEFLEQKRQEKEDLEAIISGHEEEESSNDTNENVVFIDPTPQKESTETWVVPPVVKEETIKKQKEEESVKVFDVPADTKDAQVEQKQGEKDMSTNKTDYYYADPERETADYLAEHTSPDVKTAEKVNPVENNIEQPEDAAENPQAKIAVNDEQPKTDNLQTAVRNTFRDLNNLDAHMPVGQVLARLEDVEFKENETQKKELFDEIKRQYQLKRENPDYKVQGLNGRINSTDMLKFAQHIDNVIDDGEPDNIDYTQGHTEKIRSLATLDRHLQISEVLARLEDVAAKTQDPNEQALLDLVREGYEEKRKSPENDLSGLNSFVDSTAALNLAKRIDLAIDDGEIENVDCLIMDTVQVNDSENDLSASENSLLTVQEKAVVDAYHQKRTYNALTAEEQQIWRSLGRKVEEATSAEDVLKIVGADYSVGKNGMLKVHGHLPLGHLDLKKLPNMSDVVVEGNFACHDNQISNLEGAPGIVLGNVFAGDNPELESLEGKPRYIGGHFNVDNCPKLPSEALSELSNDLTREIRRPAPFSKDEEEVRMAPPERPEIEGEEEEVIRRLIKSTRPEIEGEEDLEVRRPGVSERYDEAEATDLEGRPDSWKLPEGAMKKGPGFEGNWEQGPDMSFKLTGVWKGSFKPYVRPYYFNPNVLTDEEKHRAMKMLTLRGIYPEHEMATEDMHTSLNPIREGDAVWVIRDKEQIKKLKDFWKAGRKNRDIAFGIDLYTPTSKEGTKPKKTKDSWKDGGARKDLWKGVKGAGKELWEGVKGAGGIVGDQLKDVFVPLNTALDKFNKDVFDQSFNNPEELGSQMLMSMLAFPFNFLDAYLQLKANKYADLGTGKKDKEDKTSASSGLSGGKERQAKALQEFMKKMIEKDPELFGEMAEKGVLGPKTEAMNQEQKTQNAQQILMQPENQALMKRLKGVFAGVAKENPELLQGIYPADYKGPVTPEVLLNHVMGWDKTSETNADRTVVPPTADRTVVPPTGPALSPEMQAIMQQMQLLTAEIQGLREEVGQLRQENAQLKEQMNQLQTENAQLKTENAQLRAELESYRSGKVKPEVISEAEQPKTAAEDVKPIEQNKKEFSFPDLNKLGSLNNLNETMARNIMDDDVPGFKETASMTPEQLAQSPKAQFFNKVRSAYSTGEKPAGLNDLIQTSEQAGWAEELAHAVENDNGNNVPRITKDLIVTSKSEVEKTEISKTPETVVQTPVVDATKTEPAKTEVETPSQSAPVKEVKSVDVAEPKKDQLTPSEEKQAVVASEDSKPNQMTPAQVKEMIRDFFQELEKNGYSLQKADVVVQKVASAEIKTKTSKKKEQVQKKQETAKKLVEKTEKLSEQKDTLTKAQREFVQSHLGLQGIDLNKKQDGFVYKDDGQELSDHAIKQVVGHETKGKYATKTGLIELFQKLHTLDKEVAAKYGFEFKEVKVAQATVQRSRKSSAVQKTQTSKTTAEKSSTSQNVSGQMMDKFLKSSMR